MLFTPSTHSQVDITIVCYTKEMRQLHKVMALAMYSVILAVLLYQLLAFVHVKLHKQSKQTKICLFIIFIEKRKRHTKHVIVIEMNVKSAILSMASDEKTALRAKKSMQCKQKQQQSLFMGLYKNKLVKNKRYNMENMRIFNVHTMTIE